MVTLNCNCLAMTFVATLIFQKNVLSQYKASQRHPSKTYENGKKIIRREECDAVKLDITPSLCRAAINVSALSVDVSALLVNYPDAWNMLYNNR